MSVLRSAFAALLLCAFAASPALAQNQLSGRPSQDDSYSSRSGVEGKDDTPASGTATTGRTETVETTAAPTFGNSGIRDSDGNLTLDIEYIILFDSDILIGADGTLTVRERITVNAKNERINHGIYRDFPTTYTDRLGNRVRVQFDVVSVTRDDHEEPYSLESLSNGQRVRMGSADITLNPGQHTYVLTYKTNRQVGFFEGYDEIYWNATGNGWGFAIGKAVATVHLPPGASILQTSYYTGHQGEAGKEAREQRIDSSTVRFTTTSLMGVEEGLTVAVGFTKGVVAPPSSAEETQSFLMDNASTGAALIGLIALALYFGYAWWKVGRDPDRGTIVPLFAPPKDISAPAARFISRMGYDRKAFAAALIGMAVKGFLTIKEEKSVYTLVRTGKSEDETGLSTAERALARKLFLAQNEIILKNSNHTTVQGAISALQSALRNEDEGVYFNTNRSWFWIGVVILALSAVATALLSDQGAETLAALVPVTIWSVGATFMVHRAWMSWQSVSGPGFRIFNVIGAVFTTLFAAIVLLVVGGGLMAFGSQILPTASLIALTVQGVMAFVFYRLLKAPTVAGQKIRDQIDGFKMFMEAAEKDRLEILHPPKVTPEVFEKYLPYAIALDCENQWSKKFEAEAAAAGIDTTRTGYTPVWYSGSSFGRLGTTGFVSAVGTAIGTAAASAAVAPGSRSGSGGGGFSGGGGGGGGGGGW